MARLLATGDTFARRPVDRDAEPAADVPPLGADRAVPAPEPPRPVHVAAPEPEPEPGGEPATLEALANRFGRPKSTPPSRGVPASERSRQEREKQAAILARLRGEADRDRQ